MKTSEILKLMDDEAFLDKIYRFSYHRCATAFEAEDLCSDIILEVLIAVQKQEKIENFYAFVWAIAHRVYADYSEKRIKIRQTGSLENIEPFMVAEKNEIDVLLDKEEDTDRIKKIFSEIAYLSKAYREVMVMYYIDELKIKEIALRLNISETTVKQRLFSARNEIRKEVEIMNNRNHTLKPVRLAIFGCGNPAGNNPGKKAERIFSQNLIYLCKNKPKTAKELSEELGVPMPYVEEELEIQCRGENGEYGLLRKQNDNKYISNVLIVDYNEYNSANDIYRRHTPEFCRIIKNTLEANREKILQFPYLNRQTDLEFLLWAFISGWVWDFEMQVRNLVAQKYYSDVIPANRKYSVAAVAFTEEQNPEFDFYGRDKISASEVNDYKSVSISNLYGKRLDKHFDCGHNISLDEKLLLTIRSLGGLSVSALDEQEKEIAAKCIECGYLRKTDAILEPGFIVIEKKHKKDFERLGQELGESTEPLAEIIAEELASFMKKNIPSHLQDEHQVYVQLIAGVRILSDVIEECIKDNLLSEPQNRIGAEGILMVVEK